MAETTFTLTQIIENNQEDTMKEFDEIKSFIEANFKNTLLVEKIQNLKTKVNNSYSVLEKEIDDHIGELTDYKSKLLSDWLWNKMDGMTAFECDREADSILEI